MCVGIIGSLGPCWSGVQLPFDINVHIRPSGLRSRKLARVLRCEAFLSIHRRLSAYLLFVRFFISFIILPVPCHPTAHTDSLLPERSPAVNLRYQPFCAIQAFPFSMQILLRAK